MRPTRDEGAAKLGPISNPTKLVFVKKGFAQ